MPELYLQVLDRMGKGEAEDEELFAIVRSVTSPEQPLDPATAASTIDTFLAELYADHYPGDQLIIWFWSTICDIARQLPPDSSQQDRLIALLESLKGLPPRELEYRVEGDVRKKTLWRGNFPWFSGTLQKKLDEGEQPHVFTEKDGVI